MRILREANERDFFFDYIKMKREWFSILNEEVKRDFSQMIHASPTHTHTRVQS